MMVIINIIGDVLIIIVVTTILRFLLWFSLVFLLVVTPLSLTTMFITMIITKLKPSFSIIAGSNSILSKMIVAILIVLITIFSMSSIIRGTRVILVICW